MAREIKSRPQEVPVIESISVDGTHRLEFNEKTHRYKLDGKHVPGATTIGHVYPKGEGLIRWMIEQGIEEYEKKAALEKGGEIGTFLHEYAEMYETGTAATHGRFLSWLDRKNKSMYAREIMRVVDLFLAWRKSNEDEVLMMEELCASPSLQVGGRIDTLRERKGLGLVLSDYKTTKSIYISHLLQVIGGYRRMLREWHGIEVPYVEIVKFPKQENEQVETLLCDAEGFTRNSEPRVVLPGLFQTIERQFESNLATYRFQKEVENKIFPPHFKDKE